MTKAVQTVESTPKGSDAERAFVLANACIEQEQKEPAQPLSQQLSKSYQFLQGKVERLIVELDEVSAQKDVELESKKRLANRMQALLDFLPGGVIVLDAKGYIIQSNPAAREMLKHPLNQFKWRDLIASCFAPRDDDGLEISTIEGRRISVSTASLDSQGQVILLTDQTETRLLQEKASRQDKLSSMGRMVSALAHQIRTPLSAAILYANHLCSQTISESKRHVFTHKLLGRLNHMEEQVKDMLLFVRNELPLNDVICLEDLEEGLKAAMEVPLATTKSRCFWQNAIPKTEIKCNREALIGAFLNLVNNSIQACENNARLKVSFCRTALDGEPAISIAIADNGPGMSTDELAASQQVFYTTKAQGTGLGLSVVHSVARAHGGEFSLHSEVGRGACGTLIIPIVNRYSK